MTILDSGLTGRDVIAKTFSTRTRRGYDPIEVDAYLEQVASRIDSLIAEIERLQAAPSELAAPPPPPPPAPELVSQVAPEPATVSAPEPAPVAPAAPTTSDDQGEAAQIVLQMAEKASREALEQAHTRADEIVSEAEFKASEIQREADRKAFEVSTRTQGELRAVEGEIETRRIELDSILGAIVAQRDRLRGIGVEITNMADGIDVSDSAVLDLREARVDNHEVDTADVP